MKGLGILLLFVPLSAQDSAQRTVPGDRGTCLAEARRQQDIQVAQPLYDCWRAGATRDEMIAQATSSPLLVRVLALHALTGPYLKQSLVAPKVRVPQAPRPPGPNVGSMSWDQPTIPPPPEFDAPTRQRLLQSTVEVLSHKISSVAGPDTLDYQGAAYARSALWELAGHDMAVALEFADLIQPAYGRTTSVGRFGESYDLASKDRPAYAARRRPRQLLAAGLAVLPFCLLLVLRRVRRPAAAMAAAMALWTLWCAFVTDFRELPPAPLYYLTASCLAFLSAGLATAAFSAWRVNPWVKGVSAPLAGAALAVIVCGVTRWGSFYPVGSEGWELIFEPLASGLIAAPVTLLLTLIFACGTRPVPVPIA